ncbi:MAG: glycoside hydrolase family 30 beta sandwich domain-containing protein [Ginsengibacter sp.]
MSKQKIITGIIIIAGFTALLFACSKKSSGGNSNVTPPGSGTNDMEFWLTKGDQYVLLKKQSVVLSFGTTTGTNAVIDVDDAHSFQTIDGFGYTLTGGSAFLINQLSAADKANLLKELFGNDSNSISISYLRISIGASDLNSSVFSYDDMPAGQSDIALTNFSLLPDQTDLIPLLKEILVINPNIKILATPWSAPVWMKDNGNSKGGSLLTQYYDVYAKYFVKYIQQMKAEGITITAITPQNEPLNGDNNPSLVMTAAEQTNFIKSNLGPAFQAAGIITKIITYDHNCDHVDYPITVFSDAAAYAFTAGSAFHLYAGDITSLEHVHNAYPDKAIYFTEQFTSSDGHFEVDLKWHLKNVIIGSMRNWSVTALEWNLANDPNYGPHTPGGCTGCKGALTIGSTITRNVAYYIIAHVSKFVPPGSVRITSNGTADLQTVAFKTPANKKVMVVENDGSRDVTFNIRFNNKSVVTTLPGGAVGTYIW